MRMSVPIRCSSIIAMRSDRRTVSKINLVLRNGFSDEGRICFHESIKRVTFRVLALPGRNASATD